jgi:hypothetical protein
LAVPAAVEAVALAPAAAAVLGPAAVQVGKVALQNADKIATVAGLAAAMSGVQSPHPKLPGDSPLKPKTHIEEVTKASNRPKLPTAGIGGKLLSIAAAIIGIAVEPPKPPAQPEKPPAAPEQSQ